MVHIIAISDAWGSHYGGISTLNYELCSAFAKNPGVKITCVLPFVEQGYRTDNNVHLVGIYKERETRVFSEGWEHIMEQRFKELKMDINTIDFCIGHDDLLPNVEAVKNRILGRF